MRTLLRFALVILAIPITAAAYTIWQNNRPVAQPGTMELQSALDRSINWLNQNRHSILNKHNHILWHMIQEAGRISGDARLQELFSEYEKTKIANSPNNIWRALYYPHTWTPIRFDTSRRLPDYNWFFIYGYTCDDELGKIPLIAAQTELTYCDDQITRPACATHQMMGFLLMKREQCGDQALLQEKITSLQARIRNQLTWDPRIVDVYMQRILMLVESGGQSLVKPVWLNNILGAQQPDGGWSPFMPLIPVGSGKYIGTKRLLSVETPKSTFHMTAQGTLLFAILAHHQE